MSFYDGSNSLGSALLNGSGQASFTTSALSTGGSPHSITAVYVGDVVFGASTSSIFSQTIIAPGAFPLPVINGLVAYYPLSSNGVDAWAGNNLTLVGSPGFSSGAINWNGAVPTVGYSSPQQWPQGGLTVAAWINMTDPTANYVVAACYGNSSATANAAYFQFFTWGSGLYARVIQNIDASYIGRGTPGILTAGWHLVAFTWSGGTAASSIAIYLDGAQVDHADESAGNFTAPYAGNTLPLSLGAELSAGYGIGGAFFGSQKGVALYNRALSASEISSLYSGGAAGTMTSTTTVVSSQNPAAAGNPVTFTATVSGSGGTPTGTVSFNDSGSNLGSASLNGSGQASFSTSGLSASGSPHSITAVYAGDSVFAGSTSSVLSQVITNQGGGTTFPLAITNGLVAYYPLASNGVDLWAGNNLTLVGSPGFSSGSVNWNGAVPTLGYSSPEQWPQGGLTVAAWINMTNPTANYVVASCYGNSSGTANAAYFQFFTWGSGLIARVIQNIDANYIGRVTPGVLTSGWHFVAFTWSGGATSSSIAIYLDGSEVDNANANGGTFTAPYAGNNLPLSLGALSLRERWCAAAKTLILHESGVA